MIELTDAGIITRKPPGLQNRIAANDAIRLKYNKFEPMTALDIPETQEIDSPAR